MPDESVVRGATLAVLAAALCALFVLGGAGWPTAPSSPPSYEEFDRNYDAYVGETVEMGGTVVETDPVVVEMDYETGLSSETTYRIELVGALEADVGDGVYFYGEVRPDRRVAVDAERTVVRAPWEVQYMYAVSVVAVLLVVARFVNGWRFRPRALAFAPRERSLYRRWRGDGDA